MRRLPLPAQCKHLRRRVFGVQDPRDGRPEEGAVPRKEARRCGEAPHLSVISWLVRWCSARAGAHRAGTRALQPSDPYPPDIPPELEDQYRLIQYAFPAEFLKARTIGTALVFSVGAQEVRARNSPLFQHAAATVRGHASGEDADAATRNKSRAQTAGQEARRLARAG